MDTRGWLAGAVPLLVLMTACAEAGPDADAEADALPGDDPAVALDTAEAGAGQRAATVRLEPTEGNDVSGTVTLTEMNGVVRVSADITGLEEGEHGFHIHETGDCTAPDASSAGGHFAPAGSTHGGPDQQPPQAHVGDMGNITADASGRATYEAEFDDMTFGGERGILGRAIIVHAGRDDLESQPSGDAGPRLACGVIPETAGTTGAAGGG